LAENYKIIKLKNFSKKLNNQVLPNDLLINIIIHKININIHNLLELYQAYLNLKKIYQQENHLIQNKL